MMGNSQGGARLADLASCLALHVVSTILFALAAALALLLYAALCAQRALNLWWNFWGLAASWSLSAMLARYPEYGVPLERLCFYSGQNLLMTPILLYSLVWALLPATRRKAALRLRRSCCHFPIPVPDFVFGLATLWDASAPQLRQLCRRLAPSQLRSRCAYGRRSIAPSIMGLFLLGSLCHVAALCPVVSSPHSSLDSSFASTDSATALASGAIAACASLGGTLKAHGYDGDDMRGMPLAPGGGLINGSSIIRVASLNVGLSGIRAVDTTQKQRLTSANCRWNLIKDYLRRDLGADIWILSETGISTQQQQRAMRSDLRFLGYNSCFSSKLFTKQHTGVVIASRTSLPVIGHHDIVPGRVLKLTIQGQRGTRFHVVAFYGDPGSNAIDSASGTTRGPRSAVNESLLKTLAENLPINSAERDSYLVAGDFNLLYAPNYLDPHPKAPQLASASKERSVLCDFLTIAHMSDLLRTVGRESARLPSFFRSGAHPVASCLDYVLGCPVVKRGLLRAAIDHNFGESDHRILIVDLLIPGVSTPWTESKWSSFVLQRLSDDQWKRSRVAWIDIQKRLKDLTALTLLELDLSDAGSSGSIDDRFHSVSKPILDFVEKLAPPRPPPRPPGGVAKRKSSNRGHKIGALVTLIQRSGPVAKLRASARRLDAADPTETYGPAWIASTRRLATTLCDKARRAHRRPHVENFANDADDALLERLDGSVTERVLNKVRDSAGDIDHVYVPSASLPHGSAPDPLIQTMELTRDPPTVIEYVRSHMERWCNIGARTPCPTTLHAIATGDLSSLSPTQQRMMARLPHLKHNARALWASLRNALTVDEIESLAAKGLLGHRKVAPGLSRTRTAWLLMLPAGTQGLVRVFNEVLASGTMPDDWLKVMIALVAKDADRMLSLDNARPISLVEEPRKALEEILKRRIEAILLALDILDDMQYARPGRTVKDALTFIRTFYEESRALRLFIHVALMDMAKCHDSPPFWVVFASFVRLGCDEDQARFLVGFLKRRACVRTAYGVSAFFEVNGGFPQGSPLAALFWACVFDMVLSELRLQCLDCFPVLHNNVVMPVFWADDCWAPAISDACMARVVTCFGNATAAIGVDTCIPKSLYTTNDPRVDPDFSPALGGLKMQRVAPDSSHRVLGILFTLSGSWSPHIEYVRARVARVLLPLDVEKCGLSLCHYVINDCVMPMIAFGGSIISSPEWDILCNQIDASTCVVAWRKTSPGETTRAPVFASKGLDLRDAWSSSVVAFTESLVSTLSTQSAASRLVRGQLLRLGTQAYVAGCILATPEAFNTLERRTLCVAYAAVQLLKLKLHVDVRGLDQNNLLHLSRPHDVPLVMAFVAQAGTPLGSPGGEGADDYRDWQRGVWDASCRTAAHLRPAFPRTWLGQFVQHDTMDIFDPGCSTTAWGLCDQFDLLRRKVCASHGSRTLHNTFIVSLPWDSSPPAPPSTACARRLIHCPKSAVAVAPLPPSLSLSLDDRQHAVESQDWMLTVGRDGPLPPVLARVAGTAGYAQIHGDGSSRSTSGHSYAVEVIQSSSTIVHSAFVPALPDGKPLSYQMEVLAQARGSGVIVSGTAALDFNSDNKGFLTRARRLCHIIMLTGHIPTNLICRWGARRCWFELAWNLLRLSCWDPRVLFCHTRGHQTDDRSVTVLNCRQDERASAQYDSPTPAPFSDMYYPPFELDVALCSSTAGALPGRPVLSLRDAVTRHWDAAWSKLAKRGALPSFLSTVDVASISPWSFSICSSSWHFASVVRTRLKTWRTHARSARFGGLSEDEAVCPLCDKWLVGGVRDDTCHAQSCPSDRARRGSHVAEWFRRLAFAVPGLFLHASFLPEQGDVTAWLAEANTFSPDTRFSLSSTSLAGVDVTVNAKLIASVSILRFCSLATAAQGDWGAVVSAIQWGVDNATELSKNGWTTPIAFMHLLVSIWGVWGELFSCSLNMSPLLGVHVSGRAEDTAFGMIFDCFSASTRNLIRTHPGRAFLMNPPYNEGSTGESSAMMDASLAWAGKEYDAAESEGRDLCLLAFIPYQRGKPAWRAVARLGHRARVILTMKTGSFSFDSGNAWHLPSSHWPHASGAGHATTFPCALIEIASSAARTRMDLSGVYSASNAARVMQWSSTCRDRGSVSGLMLNNAVWSLPVLDQACTAWASLRVDPSWVASELSCPIHPDFGNTMGITLRPLASTWRRQTLFDSLHLFPTAAWHHVLLPSALQTLPALVGISSAGRWKGACTRLGSLWASVETDRTVPASGDFAPLRLRARAHRAATSLMSTLGVSRAALGARAAKVYGVDLGRPAAAVLP